MPSLSVIDDLCIHVLRYLPGEAHSYANNLLGIKTRKIAQDCIGTITALACGLEAMML